MPNDPFLQKLIFDIEIENEGQFEEVNSFLKNFFYNSLESKIEKILQKYKADRIRLEKLEIDLGFIDLEQSSFQEIIQTFEDQLTGLIEKSKTNAEKGEIDTFLILHEYLKYGTYSWGVTSKEDFYSRIINYKFQKKEFFKIQQLLGVDQRAKKRWNQIISDVLFWNYLKKLRLHESTIQKTAKEIYIEDIIELKDLNFLSTSHQNKKILLKRKELNFFEGFNLLDEFINYGLTDFEHPAKSYKEKFIKLQKIHPQEFLDKLISIPLDNKKELLRASHIIDWNRLNKILKDKIKKEYRSIVSTFISAIDVKSSLQISDSLYFLISYKLLFSKAKPYDTPKLYLLDLIHSLSRFSSKSTREILYLSLIFRNNKKPLNSFEIYLEELYVEYVITKTEQVRNIKNFNLNLFYDKSGYVKDTKQLKLENLKVIKSDLKEGILDLKTNTNSLIHFNGGAQQKLYTDYIFDQWGTLFKKFLPKEEKNITHIYDELIFISAFFEGVSQDLSSIESWNPKDAERFWKSMEKYNKAKNLNSFLLLINELMIVLNQDELKSYLRYYKSLEGLQIPQLKKYRGYILSLIFNSGYLLKYSYLSDIIDSIYWERDLIDHIELFFEFRNEITLLMFHPFSIQKVNLNTRKLIFKKLETRKIRIETKNQINRGEFSPTRSDQSIKNNLQRTLEDNLDPSLKQEKLYLNFYDQLKNDQKSSYYSESINYFEKLLEYSNNENNQLSKQYSFPVNSIDQILDSLKSFEFFVKKHHNNLKLLIGFSQITLENKIDNKFITLINQINPKAAEFDRLLVKLDDKFDFINISLDNFIKQNRIYLLMYLSKVDRFLNFSYEEFVIGVLQNLKKKQLIQFSDFQKFISRVNLNKELLDAFNFVFSNNSTKANQDIEKTHDFIAILDQVDFVLSNMESKDYAVNSDNLDNESIDLIQLFYRKLPFTYNPSRSKEFKEENKFYFDQLLKQSINNFFNDNETYPPIDSLEQILSTVSNLINFLKQNQTNKEILLSFAEMSLKDEINQRIVELFNEINPSIMKMEQYFIELQTKFSLSTYLIEEFSEQLRVYLIFYLASMNELNDFDAEQLTLILLDNLQKNRKINLKRTNDILNGIKENDSIRRGFEISLNRAFKSSINKKIKDDLYLGQLAIYVLAQNKLPFWSDSKKYTIEDAYYYFIHKLKEQDFNFIEQVLSNSTSNQYVKKNIVFEEVEVQLEFIKFHHQNIQASEHLLSLYKALTESSLLNNLVSNDLVLNFFISENLSDKSSIFSLMENVYFKLFKNVGLSNKEFEAEIIKHIPWFTNFSTNHKDHLSEEELEWYIKYYIETGEKHQKLKSIAKSEWELIVKDQILKSEAEFDKYIIWFSKSRKSLYSIIELLGINNFMTKAFDWINYFGSEKRTFLNLLLEFIDSLDKIDNQTFVITEIINPISVKSDQQFTTLVFKNLFDLPSQILIKWIEFLKLYEAKDLPNGLLKNKIIQFKSIDFETIQVQNQSELVIKNDLDSSILRYNDEMFRSSSSKNMFEILEYYIEMGSLKQGFQGLNKRQLSFFFYQLVEKESLLIKKSLHDWSKNITTTKRIIDLVEDSKKDILLDIIHPDLKNKIKLLKELLLNVLKKEKPWESAGFDNINELVLFIYKYWSQTSFMLSNSMYFIVAMNTYLIKKIGLPLLVFINRLKTTKIELGVNENKFFNDFQLEIEKKLSNSKESEDSNPDILSDELEKGNFVSIQNSGLVILWPYLYQLFDKLGLIEQKKIKSGEIDKAVVLTHFLVYGEVQYNENMLILNKILCGVKEATFIGEGLELSDFEKEICGSLLKSVINNWEKLSSTSIETFRLTFLQREGVLTRHLSDYTLNVEHKAYDLLLDTLPWNISMIQTAFMKNRLLVEWKTK